MRLLLFIFVTLSNAAFAVDIPMDFLYKGQLIDPFCFYKTNTEREVNLAECSDKQSKFITGYFIFDDFYGYKFLDPESLHVQSSIGYKYLGKIKDLHVVETFILGGSLGRISFIKYYKLKNGMLQMIKSGPSGDRSFGGIKNTKVSYGSLYYDMALTPKLFMSFFPIDEKSKEVIENLPDCAICQFAILSFRDDKIQKVKLNSVLIDKPNNSATECLAQIHKRYIDHNRLELSPKETKSLVATFERECVRGEKLVK